MRPASFAFLAAILPVLVAAAPLELETRQKDNIPGICLMVCYDQKQECGKTGVSDFLNYSVRMLLTEDPML